VTLPPLVARALSFFRITETGTQVPAWFHAFVKDTNDFDDPGLPDAIVNDVHWLSDGAGTTFPTRVPQVEATDARNQIVSIPRGRAFWSGCDLSHSRHE
jgi:hypothetical protein